MKSNDHYKSSRCAKRGFTQHSKQTIEYWAHHEVDTHAREVAQSAFGDYQKIDR